MCQIKQATILILAAILALSLHAYLVWTEGYWIVLTTLFMLMANNSTFFARTAILIAVSGLLAALTTFLANLAAYHFIFLGTYLFITTAISIYIGGLYADMFISIFIINLFGILSGSFATNMNGSIERCTCILLGTTLALFIWGLLGRGYPEKSARHFLAASLASLSELSKAIFSCYINHNYQEKYFSYEKLLQEKRKNILLSLHDACQMIERITEKKRHPFNVLLNRLESIYELILGLGALRYRESDQSTFEMGASEFSAISTDIVLMLNDLRKGLLRKKDNIFSINSLLENILQLEEINNSAFQVTAKEPIAFTIMIHYLRNLSSELNQLFVDISASNMLSTL